MLNLTNTASAMKLRERLPRSAVMVVDRTAVRRLHRRTMDMDTVRIFTGRVFMDRAFMARASDSFSGRASVTGADSVAGAFAAIADRR